MKKKGQMLGNIQGMIAPLVGIAIILVIGFLIMTEVKDQVVSIESSDWCPDGFGYDTTENTCCNSTAATCTGSANRTTAGKSYAYNSTETTQKAMDDIPGWLPIVIVAVIGALLLGLVAYFRSK